MLTITIKVNAPPGMAMGIKEDLAMYLERYGDAKVISIDEKNPVQTTFGGFENEKPETKRKRNNHINP